MLETIGRTSGALVMTPVGFIEDDDGSLFVAAGSDAADWALNLRTNPRCRATIGERVAAFEASELEVNADRGQAIAEMILKYGTPAEKLGHGPVFHLLPMEDEAARFAAFQGA